jgi:hypothetical protein
MKTHLTLCCVLILGSAGVFADDNAHTPKSVPGNVLADFTVTPPDPPNEGILFVNHKLASRSGHLGHALVEAADGKILAFYADCSDDDEGHSGVGWMECKRSTDGGRTWSKPEPHPHSKRVNSLVVGSQVPAEPNRLLIQASHAYRGNRTNVLHWWIKARGPNRSNSKKRQP